jgi:hypothetical protein
MGWLLDLILSNHALTALLVATLMAVYASRVLGPKLSPQSQNPGGLTAGALTMRIFIATFFATYLMCYFVSKVAPSPASTCHPSLEEVMRHVDTRPPRF